MIWFEDSTNRGGLGGSGGAFVAVVLVGVGGVLDEELCLLNIDCVGSISASVIVSALPSIKAAHVFRSLRDLLSTCNK